MRIGTPSSQLGGNSLIKLACFFEKDGQQLFINLIVEQRNIWSKCRLLGRLDLGAHRFRLRFRCYCRGFERFLMGLGRGLGGDDCGRIQAVKLIDQTEGKVDVLLVSKCREHQIQFANRSFNCPEGFQTFRVFGVIAPQQGVFKGISQLIDGRQTDGQRSA